MPALLKDQQGGGYLKAQRYRISGMAGNVKLGNYLFPLIIHMRLLRTEKHI